MLDRLKRILPSEGHLCLPGCGKCCVADAPLGEAEYEEIAAWLPKNVTPGSIQAQFAHADTQPDICPFLKPDRSCFVYPVRPVVCRIFGHLADVPGMPRKDSQRCPQGVAFSSVDRGLFLATARPWFLVLSEKRILLKAFRKAIVGITPDGVKVQI